MPLYFLPPPPNYPQSIHIASSTSEYFFIDFNNSSDNLFEISKCENNSFKDLTLYEDNTPSSPSFFFNQWLNPSNYTNYPSLYRMAINFLFVLPMSAKPKCIFLRTWQTIYQQQMSFGHLNIKQMECLKSWIKGRIASEWRKELLVNVLEKEAEGG